MEHSYPGPYLNPFSTFIKLIEKSKRLEENLKKLEEERKRSDELLYLMMPQPIAERLKNGAAAIDTCEVMFGSVYSHNRFSIRLFVRLLVCLFVRSIDQTIDCSFVCSCARSIVR